MPSAGKAALAALMGLLAADTRAQAEIAAPPSFEVCAPCHSLKAGENINGPSLNGLMKRPAGSLEGYRFSGPMKRSGLVWDAKTLREYITDPQAKVPGTRMPFSGLEDPSEVTRLVEYLERATAASP